jgi:hypothetical protein
MKAEEGSWDKYDMQIKSMMAAVLIGFAVTFDPVMATLSYPFFSPILPARAFFEYLNSPFLLFHYV